MDEGRVILRGRVESWAEKQLAIEVVKSVKGVKDVLDSLILVPAEDRSDADIQNEIERLLKDDPLLEDLNLRVRVENGAVRVKGGIVQAVQRQLIRNHCWVNGVHGVTTDLINLQPESGISTVVKDLQYRTPADTQIRWTVEEACCGIRVPWLLRSGWK